MWSTARRALLQHVEPTPRHQDLGLQPLSRLEAVAQQTDEQKADCYHSAINALVLLRHKARRMSLLNLLAQHGHRGRALATATARPLCSVAIELGT
jgi:hypothetical protein